MGLGRELEERKKKKQSSTIKTEGRRKEKGVRKNRSNRRLKRQK